MGRLGRLPEELVAAAVAGTGGGGGSVEHAAEESAKNRMKWRTANTASVLRPQLAPRRKHFWRMRVQAGSPAAPMASFEPPPDSSLPPPAPPPGVRHVLA